MAGSFIFLFLFEAKCLMGLLERNKDSNHRMDNGFLTKPTLPQRPVRGRNTMSSLSAPSLILGPQTKDKVGFVGNNRRGYVRDKVQPMSDSTDYARRTSPLWRLDV